MILDTLLVMAAGDPASPYITPGGQIIIALIVALGGILVARIEKGSRLTRRSVEAAETAAERSEPTGNGFAGDIRSTLTRIEREISGIREEQRTERVERIALARALSAHIERNDS